MNRLHMLAAAAASGRMRYGEPPPPAAPTPWSPVLIQTFVRSGANLNIVSEASSTVANVMSTSSKASGKYYFELSWAGSTGTLDAAVGIRRAGEAVTTAINAGQTCALRAAAQTYNGSSGATINASSAISFVAADTLGIALDMDNLKMWVRKTGTWPNSGDPAAGTNPLFSGFTAGAWHIYAWANNDFSNHTGTLNSGFSAFANAPPAGFTAGFPL